MNICDGSRSLCQSVRHLPPGGLSLREGLLLSSESWTTVWNYGFSQEQGATLDFSTLTAFPLGHQDTHYLLIPPQESILFQRITSVLA